MRGFRRQLSGREKVRVFSEGFGPHGDAALIVVTDEVYLFDIAVQNHLLHSRPFDFLRPGARILEQEVAYAEDDDKVYPGEIDADYFLLILFFSHLRY